MSNATPTTARSATTQLTPELIVDRHWKSGHREDALADIREYGRSLVKAARRVALICGAWEAAILSEGQAARMLGQDRLEARIKMAQWRADLDAEIEAEREALRQEVE